MPTLSVHSFCAMQICEQVKEPTAFVIEQGQPNLAFVEKIMQAMIESGDSCMTSVRSAKKADFIELHPADFVSHCASSYDKPFLERLFKAKLLKHGHITQRVLAETAPEVSRIIRRARNIRLKAKPSRR